MPTITGLVPTFTRPRADHHRPHANIQHGPIATFNCTGLLPHSYSDLLPTIYRHHADIHIHIRAYCQHSHSHSHEMSFILSTFQQQSITLPKFSVSFLAPADESILNVPLTKGDLNSKLVVSPPGVSRPLRSLTAAGSCNTSTAHIRHQPPGEMSLTT